MMERQMNAIDGIGGGNAGAAFLAGHAESDERSIEEPQEVPKKEVTLHREGERKVLSFDTVF